jgi:hypothetical protein
VGMRNLVWKYKLPNHLEIKDQLLQIINNIPYERVESEESGFCDIVSKTDYYLKMEDRTLDYYQLLRRNLTEFFNFICSYYCLSKFEVTSYWFQQYCKDNIHHWHIHPDTSVAMVYFLELSNPNNSTEFYDVINKKIFKHNVQEGDILVFPAIIPHRSPLITTNSKKTIISCNINFVDVDPKKIKL